jgi:23S rRNA pseudouridine2605 synthase
MHPRHGVAKTSLAEVEGDPSAAALRRLAEGVELEDGPTAAAGVRRLAPSTIELVIHEGRNRQVRRMLEAVGHPVRSLHRSAYGGIELGDLPSGGWRRLSAGELERLGRA